MFKAFRSLYINCKTAAGLRLIVKGHVIKEAEFNKSMSDFWGGLAGTIGSVAKTWTELEAGMDSHDCLLECWELAFDPKDKKRNLIDMYIVKISDPQPADTCRYSIGLINGIRLSENAEVYHFYKTIDGKGKNAIAIKAFSPTNGFSFYDLSNQIPPPGLMWQ